MKTKENLAELQSIIRSCASRRGHLKKQMGQLQDSIALLWDVQFKANSKIAKFRPLKLRKPTKIHYRMRDRRPWEARCGQWISGITLSNRRWKNVTCLACKRLHAAENVK